MILFSIVIPTCNRANTLKSLLESILINGYDKNTYEVIVIENGNKEVCSELCSLFFTQLNIKYIFQKTEGFSAAEARNIGISNCNGNVVIFFDDDVVLKPNCIKEHLLYHYKNGNPKIVFGFRNNILNDKKISSKIGSIEEDDRIKLGLELTDKNKLWYYAYTCNLSIDFSNGKEYFDNAFKKWGNEDQEFAYRLSNKQFDVIIGKNCLVHHFTDSKIRSPFLRDKYGLHCDYRDFLLSRLYFLKKHWNDSDLRSFIIEDLKMYEYKNKRWARNQTSNTNFDLNEFIKLVDFNFE